MHEIIVTEGVVLGKRSLREADKQVAVLAPMGLLRAMARSARANQSKLRYGLEPLSRGRFSFVRGKHDWRLVGVEAVSRDFLAAGVAPRRAMAKISGLLLRLMPGTEASPELYRTIVEGFEVLSKPEANLSSVEVVLVLRMLSHLGYLPHTDALAPFIEGDFTIELSAKALEERALLVRTINESLQATGL
jgi:DNA repair protein RecO